MLVYNVTVKVDESIETEYLAWLKEIHVPDIISTGCFTHANIYQLLEIDDSEGPTYTIQYFTDSKSMYNQYLENFAEEMRQKSFVRWGNKFIAFRTLMKVVN